MASLENFQKMVANIGSQTAVKRTLPCDVHPYQHRHPLELLDQEYAREVTKIAKLPFDERKEARRSLQARYEAARQRMKDNEPWN